MLGYQIIKTKELVLKLELVRADLEKAKREYNSELDSNLFNADDKLAMIIFDLEGLEY